jgi:hypothetical protein
MSGRPLRVPNGPRGLAAESGLGKYEAAFRENEIDETVLRSVTDEHLKQLGVTALGRRLKLLDAIAAFRTKRARQRRPPSLRQKPTKPPGIPPSAARSPCCSPTWWVQPRSRVLGSRQDGLGHGLG